MSDSLSFIINKQIKSDWNFEDRLFDTTGYNKHLFSMFKNRIFAYNFPSGKMTETYVGKNAVYSVGEQKIIELSFSDDECFVVRVVISVSIRQNKYKIDPNNLMIQIKVTDNNSEILGMEALDKATKVFNGEIDKYYQEVDYYSEIMSGSEEKKIVPPPFIPSRKSKVTKLYIKNLISAEHRRNGNILEPMLNKISIDVYENDILGIYGANREEVELLMRIFGNMCPYYKGKAKLSEFGVKQKKRELIETLYYIDSTTALYGRMSVLEHLMFICSSRFSKDEYANKQKELLDDLVNMGLSDIALTKIRSITTGEKLLVQLIVGYLSGSSVIVANLQQYSFTQKEIEAFERVVKYINQKGVIFIVSASQPKFIGMVCTRAIFLVNGQIEFDGDVDELNKNWDRVICIIKGEEIEKIAAAIESEMKFIKCVIENDTLYVRNHSEKEWQIEQFYDILSKNQFRPDYIKFNKGRVENSFNELLIKYDI